MELFSTLGLNLPVETLSHSPYPLWLWGRDQQLLDCNQAAAALLQNDSAVNMRGQRPRELGLSIPPWGDVWLGKSGTPAHAELRMPGKPSLTFWARHYPVISPKGETVAALTLFEDLAPKIAASEFQLLLEHTSTGVLALTLDERVIICNPAAEKLLGLQAPLLLGQPWSKILADTNFAPDTWPTLTDSPQQVIWSSPSGSLPLTVQGHLIHDPLEKPIHIVYLVSPGEALYSLPREQSAAATIHEIRNPLTVIEGFIQLLESQFSSQEKGSLQLILSELARINRMLEDLLAFHPSPYEAPYCDCGALLEQCVYLYHPHARRDGVELELKLAAALPPVGMASGPFLQIIHNLLQNALQAISGEGKIQIRACSSPQEIILEVEDTGQGIPAGVIPCIFEPFYTTKEKGTGLGLSICQRLLADVGGWIKLARSSPEGTTFVLHLPRWDAGPAAKA